MTVQQQPPPSPFGPGPPGDGVRRPTSRQQRREERARAKRAEKAAEADRRPRRPYGQMLLALLLIAGCALGAAVAFTKAGDTTSVVVVTDGVARGETISREDLTTTRVAGVDGAVPADQLEDLVGRTAVVDLLPGQVVVTEASSSDPIPAEGETLVGAALEPSQVPDGLAAGDSVRVLAAPEEGAEPDANGAELASALVYTIDETELVGSGSGVRQVTLIVPDRDADAVALFAASDRIVVIETSTAGGGA
jgi:SAF domain-containing protein